MIGWAWIVGVAAAAPWIERAAPLTFARFVVEDDHKGVIGVSSPALRRQVSAYLRDRGLDIRGDENAVFGIDKSEAARFALGAVIDEVYHRTGPSYRELSIRFRWEVLDLRTEAVVYAGSTVGHTAGGPDRYRRELTGDVDDCIEDGLGRLLNRELFQEALTRQFDPAPAETELPDTITLAACEASRTLPQDFDDLLAGVVTLTGPDGGVGTGIIVSPDGFVVTAAHVIEGGVVTARLRAGVEVPFDVLRTVPEHDVALLRIPGSKLACVPLADA
ncbi:MAG: serine protease, partial [Myxococcota bacterium]